MNRFVNAHYEDPGISEYRGNKFIEALPAILSGEEVLHALAQRPPYDGNERKLPPHLRLHCIQRLFQFFEPFSIHVELEQRFSILLRQGYLGRNPESIDYIRHLRNGYRRVVEKDLLAVDHAVQSTAASFSIIGISGAGKSTSIHNILKLYPQVIEHAHPINLTQIVWLKIDCPPDGSLKSLCINFFQHIDQLLGTNYEAKYVRARASTDVLMGYIPMVANLHGLGVLIIDEVQNLSLAKSGGAETLLNFFVTLVNTIGLPVILIGTMKALSMLQGDFRHARRTAGVGSFTFERLRFGQQWDYLLEALWAYQWTATKTPLTPEIRETLYDETQGITDVLVKLYALTQHRAIRLEKEEITPALIRRVAKTSLSIIQPMIEALRTKDPRKIQQYSDLHVPAFNQLTEVSVSITRPVRYPVKTEDSSSKYAAVSGILFAAGMDVQSAEFLIGEISREDPDIDPMHLVQRALELYQKPDQAPPPPKVTVNKKSAKEPAVFLENDLRGIVNGSGRAYETLLRAGIIKKPLVEFTIVQ